LNNNRLPRQLSRGLEAGATVIVPSAQRQSAIRAAWSTEKREAGHKVWNSPRVFTFNQYTEQLLNSQWAAANLPDRLLPPGAEWACVRQLRRESGGAAEARALLASVRTLHDWRIPRSAAALGASPETMLLRETLDALELLSQASGRRPLRTWLTELQPSEALLAAGFESASTLQTETLQRLGATNIAQGISADPVAIATAHNDEHELELIAAWARAQLQQDPQRRLLIVDAKLRQRRRRYDRLLSQTLTPSQWITSSPRDTPTAFAIEGGRPLAEFPVIAHALLSLRLLTGRLRFDEVVHWLRLPYLDRGDVMLGSTLEAIVRKGRKLDFSAEELAALIEHGSGAVPLAFATRVRQARQGLSGESKMPAEWAPRILSALRTLGWHGSRTLRSDEQQTVTRWHALLDEYSALGAWLPRATAGEAARVLDELASERSFDPASVDAPVTLTESHDDPVVRYDGIWVAGLDAAQWPAAPRPDALIPLQLQVAASVPWSSAAGQTRAAHAALAAWRASTGTLVCSWGRLEGDAHRTQSPLLARLDTRVEYSAGGRFMSLPEAVSVAGLEFLEDIKGVPVDTSRTVPGGVKPLTLQAECGFHAYAEMRLGAEILESPVPGIDARERGTWLHKALELLWIKFGEHFTIFGTDATLWKPIVGDSVAAAELYVFRGHIPQDLRPAVERERLRLERLILKLLELEKTRAPFKIDKLEARRLVSIAGGEFEVRIDRIDSIEGGGYAILDYKTGDPRVLRWQGESIRDPQLLAYLLAERGRPVQALVNVSLTRNSARFNGKGARKGLLPGIGGPSGMSSSKIPPEELESAWQLEIGGWLSGLHTIAADYIRGSAPVQPSSDVCRNCHLTVLCRRLELAANDLEAGDVAAD
jgi:ATP-dependent helicase/nuclease subunit B